MPDLGYKPPGGWNVNLGRGNDFVQTLSRKDGEDWADGTVITLRIGAGGDAAVDWPATLDGPLVSWFVDKAAVDALADDAAGRQLPCRIDYTDAAGLDQTWVTGKIRWYA